MRVPARCQAWRRPPPVAPLPTHTRAPPRASPCPSRGPPRVHPPQDAIQQLHTALKSSDALLNQNHGQIAAVLAQLDPVQHSLGYLYLL